jgi:DNA-binding CsgD family transcriptional regulator
LAKREAEVARLVADGLTNKQIGARLFISERTVENHVRNIMNKLGFSSRAQIAGWISAPNHWCAAPEILMVISATMRSYRMLVLLLCKSCCLKMSGLSWCAG